MNKKVLCTVVMIIALVCAVAAIAAVVIMNSGDLSARVYDMDLIKGDWIEDSTEMKVTFADGGVFKIQDVDAASYSMDDQSKTLTLVYAEAFGGATSEMTYELTETTLVLTIKDSKEVQTYTKK